MKKKSPARRSDGHSRASVECMRINRHNWPADQRRFAVCDLHGIRVVDALPEGCPLRADNALLGAHAYRQRAYQRMDRAADLVGGLDDLARAETCHACVVGLSKNPHIKRLRTKANGGAANVW